MADQDDIAERLESLREVRGTGLVDALIKELAALHRQIDLLRAEMAAYRSYLAERDRPLVTEGGPQRRARLARSVAIDASQFLHPRQGFYGLEYDDRGSPFSWTGPGLTFSFDVFVDRTNGAQLEMRAVGCIDFERQKHIRLMANGEPVATTVTPSGGGMVVQAELPPTDDDTLTNLVFFVPENLRPGGEDPRLLGIAFNALNIRARDERAQKKDDTVVTLNRAGAGNT